jgi:hypothetical protein|tara:strand:- start:2889 stop:3305 length:417 start_codon:yes stop_codon:yes gene_type:complete
MTRQVLTKSQKAAKRVGADKRYNDSYLGKLRNMKYYNKHREACLKRKQDWKKEFPEEAEMSSRLSSWRCSGIKFKDKEEEKQYYAEYIKETNCYCCDKEFTTSRDKHFDHCHTCGLPRAILCMRCNVTNMVECIDCEG